MTRILLKFFVKDHENTASFAVREGYGKLAGVCGIALNFILFVMKLLVGLAAGSVSVMADAVNNLTDAASSVVTFLGFKLSAKPADKEHPFGHGRIEYVTSLIIVGIIFVLGYEFMRFSVSQIINPEPLQVSAVSAVLLVIALFVKLWMFLFNRRLGKTINSGALNATAIDSRNDALITAVTLFSLVFTRFTGYVIDGYIGVFVSLVLFYSGYKIGKDTLWTIIGKPADETLAAEIKRVLLGYDGVIGVHDLVIHNYGPGRNFASAHVEVPLEMTLGDAHAIIDTAEESVLNALGVPIVIHIDPLPRRRGEKKMKITLQVLGMSCAHCEKAIQNALEDIGAVQVIASATENTVQVHFDPDVLSEKRIRQEIVETGYEVKESS